MEAVSVGDGLGDCAASGEPDSGPSPGLAHYATGKRNTRPAVSPGWVTWTYATGDVTRLFKNTTQELRQR